MARFALPSLFRTSQPRTEACTTLTTQSALNASKACGNSAPGQLLSCQQHNAFSSKVLRENVGLAWILTAVSRMSTNRCRASIARAAAWIRTAAPARAAMIGRHRACRVAAAHLRHVVFQHRPACVSYLQMVSNFMLQGCTVADSFLSHEQPVRVVSRT